MRTADRQLAVIMVALDFKASTITSNFVVHLPFGEKMRDFEMQTIML